MPTTPTTAGVRSKTSPHMPIRLAQLCESVAARSIEAGAGELPQRNQAERATHLGTSSRSILGISGSSRTRPRRRVSHSRRELAGPDLRLGARGRAAEPIGQAENVQHRPRHWRVVATASMLPGSVARLFPAGALPGGGAVGYPARVDSGVKVRRNRHIVRLLTGTIQLRATRALKLQRNTNTSAGVTRP
jgi:hypothetical protein